MTPPTEMLTEMEKQFEKEFDYSLCCGGDYCEDHELHNEEERINIKDFTLKWMEKARQKGYEAGLTRLGNRMYSYKKAEKAGVEKGRREMVEEIKRSRPRWIVTDGKGHVAPPDKEDGGAILDNLIDIYLDSITNNKSK